MTPDNPLIEADLDEYLSIPLPVDGAWDPDSEEEPNVVGPDDEEQADRLLYKASRLTDERAQVVALAAKRRATIDSWEADRLSGIDREVGWVERSLEMFMRRWHRNHPRSKTLSLPNGRLALRAPSRGKVVVQDEAVLVEWALLHDPDLVRLDPKPNRVVLGLLDRLPGLQITDPSSGELVQSSDVLVHLTDDETGELVPTRVPGVIITERLQDRFTLSLTTDSEEES